MKKKKYNEKKMESQRLRLMKDFCKAVPLWLPGKHSGEPPQELDFYYLWMARTKEMFRQFPAMLVFGKCYELLAEVSDEQYPGENLWPKKIFSEISKKKIKVRGDIRRAIDKRLKITDVAKKYGLKVVGRKAVCPFHQDKDPSLSLNDEKNLFHCFGCGVKGDIITLISKLEEKKKWKEKKQLK